MGNSFLSLDDDEPKFTQAVDRATSWYNMVVGSWNMGRSMWTKWKNDHTYMVTLTEEDPIYWDVQDWLRREVPEHRQREVSVSTLVSVDRDARMSSSDPWDTLPGARDTVGSGGLGALRIAYDMEHEQRVLVSGHRVQVAMAHYSEGPAAASAAAGSRPFKPDSLVFRCSSLDGQRAVLALLRGFAASHRSGKRKPQLYVMASWGDSWESRSDIPARALDSVVLRRGQMERLVSDLETFFEDEGKYAQLGVPWRRGYLFQGPPGAGKTSVIKALASHFGLNLWYLPLADVKKDTNLISMMSSVRPRSLVLFEDVDIYRAATERDAGEGEERVSLSGLLNALDGVVTPHGLIVVLTSNHPDVLDEALVRSGRVDVVEELDYLDQDQAERLFRYFYGRPASGAWKVANWKSPATSADLVELFKQHLRDADGAEQVLTYG